MKTFFNFFEDVKFAKVRFEEANPTEQEAEYRQKRVHDFKQKSLEKSQEQKRKFQDILTKQKEKAEKIKSQREQQKELSAKRAAKTSAQLKSAAKETYKIGKSIVKRLKNKNDERRNNPA